MSITPSSSRAVHHRPAPSAQNADDPASACEIAALRGYLQTRRQQGRTNVDCRGRVFCHTSERRLAPAPLTLIRCVIGRPLGNGVAVPAVRHRVARAIRRALAATSAKHVAPIAPGADPKQRATPPARQQIHNQRGDALGHVSPREASGQEARSMPSSTRIDPTIRTSHLPRPGAYPPGLLSSRRRHYPTPRQPPTRLRRG